MPEKCPICGTPFKHGECTGLPIQACRCKGLSIMQDMFTDKITVRVYPTCRFCGETVPKEGFVHSACKKASLKR